jgi:hypothetical protein
MRTIWKFPLKPAVQEITMPRGARVLTVQTQFGEPQLWAEVDTDAPTEQREFAVVGTGHPMPEDPGEYIGTFQIDDGSLVFHVYASPAASVPPQRSTQ